jgi:methylation protein EvaC
MDILKNHGPADVIYAANVMCHIKDIHSVLRGISILLKKDGVFIFEDPYLPDIIDKTSFDQIYDEHCYYFDLDSVSRMVEDHGLYLDAADHLPNHGGSMRYTVKHGTPLLHPVGSDSDILGFASRIEETKKNLLNVLREAKKEGKRVVGYAATSKSTTLLNYCGIGPGLIDYIVDTTPGKQGKLSPGMHIPIKSMDHFKDVDYALLLAWNHFEEIKEKEKTFGGKWIHYIPEVYLT